jgi:hypothetical protein
MEICNVMDWGMQLKLEVFIMASENMLKYGKLKYETV